MWNISSAYYLINYYNSVTSTSNEISIGIDNSGTTSSCIYFNLKVADAKSTGAKSENATLTNSIIINSAHVGLLLNAKSHFPA